MRHLFKKGWQDQGEADNSLSRGKLLHDGWIGSDREAKPNGSSPRALLSGQLRLGLKATKTRCNFRTSTGVRGEGGRPNLLHPFQPGSLGGWRNNTLVLQHKPSLAGILCLLGECALEKPGAGDGEGSGGRPPAPSGIPAPPGGRAPSLNSVTSRRRARPGLGARRPPKARSLARPGLRMPVQQQQPAGTGDTAPRQEGARSGSRAGRGSRGSRGGRKGSPGGAG